MYVKYNCLYSLPASRWTLEFEFEWSIVGRPLPREGSHRLGLRPMPRATLRSRPLVYSCTLYMLSPTFQLSHKICEEYNFYEATILLWARKDWGQQIFGSFCASYYYSVCAPPTLNSASQGLSLDTAVTSCLSLLTLGSSPHHSELVFVYQNKQFLDSRPSGFWASPSAASHCTTSVQVGPSN